MIDLNLFRRFIRVGLLISGLMAAIFAMSSPVLADTENDSPSDDECFDIGYGTGCDVEGFVQIYADSNEVDTYSETDIDPVVADAGWNAYVEDEVDNSSSGFVDSCWNEADFISPGETDCSTSDSTALDNVYVVYGSHGVVDDNGDGFYAGFTEAWVDAIAPLVSSLDPTYAYVGTSGEIIVHGSYLFDPYDSNGFEVDISPASGGSISGMTVTPDAVTLDGTEVAVGYNIATCAGTGGRFINIYTGFGYDNGDKVFTVGDPTPNILSVSPGVWQAGQTNLPITIRGLGFGDNATLAVVGNGVTLVSTDSKSDSQILAHVTIGSGAPNQTATVTVISNGYCGSGFQAASGNPSSGTYGVPVQAQPGPIPQIFLYDQSIPTNTSPSVTVGQQIALSATVSLPQSVSISSQQWSISDGTAIGGYTNPSGGMQCTLLSNCPIPDTTGGRVLSLTPAAESQSSLTFYWLDSGGGAPAVTYTYSASNGTGNTATVTFNNVGGPSGVSVSAQVGQAIVLPHDKEGNAAPTLWFTGVQAPQSLGSNVGALYQASGTPPTGNTGAYQWVQLVSKDLIYQDDINASGACPGGVQSNGNPPLDTSYPYSPTTSSSNPTIPNDMAADSPTYVVDSAWGEVARSFRATMYLMWVPPALTGTYTCPSGNACTIPVPLGTISATPTGWIWMGDTINTLSSVQGVNQTTWIMNFDGQPPMPSFQPSQPGTDPHNGLPTWTTFASYVGKFWQCP
jgi:hypothetical protein